MHVKRIYINLPVKDVAAARAFWSALGFTFKAEFSNETAICLVLNDETMYAMLVSHDHFRTFTPRPLADGTTTQVLNALEVSSKAEVDRIVHAALQNGGSRYTEGKDIGWMYYDSFADPDGHQWEVMFLDESQIPQSEG